MMKKKFSFNLKDNPILRTDSYKYSHKFQLRKGTQRIWSYIEPRSFLEGAPDYIVAAGFNMFIKEYLLAPFSQTDIDDAAIFCEMHGEPFAREDFEYILKEHNGHWPIEIRAVAEGTVLKTSNILLSAENTDERVPWVTAWLETIILRGVWPMSTVATISTRIRNLVQQYINCTSDNPDQLLFKLHDFGARGVSSGESARYCGAGHLIPFRGTDTVEAIAAVIDYYDCSEMPGYSIPAAEHSTITSWTKDGEVEAYRNMINTFGGEGKLYAVVSDSYDIFSAIKNIWCKELKEEVLAKGGTVVIRPDSGIPYRVVLECLELLGDGFGYEINSKGYKVLHPAVRIIQGDGINYNSILKILQTMEDAGWAIDNVTFGMGGALQQHMDRDWYGWAMKCSATKINDEWIDVYKDPITDIKKHSKRGRLALIMEDDELTTVSQDMAIGFAKEDYLIPIYRNGKLLVDPTFDEVRSTYEKSAYLFFNKNKNN